MAAFKVLAAVLVVCVAQNVAYAGFFDHEFDELSLLKAANVRGSLANFLECLPKLTDTYKYLQELKTLFREYRDITVHYFEAKSRCRELPSSDVVSQEKCFKDAEDAMVAQKLEYFKGVDEFLSRTYNLFSQFKECLRKPNF